MKEALLTPLPRDRDRGKEGAGEGSSAFRLQALRGPESEGLFRLGWPV